MEKLVMPLTILSQMITLAQQHAPHECCGLLGGLAEAATTLIPVPNASVYPEISYVMDEQRMVESILMLRRQGLDVVGIYHSHPHEAAVPSAADIASATWTDAAYVIVGWAASAQREVRAWWIRAGRVNEVRIEAGDP
jgi:proteasome lid subunit RPN8/RPN11